MINEVYKKQRELEDRFKELENNLYFLSKTTTELARSTSGLVDSFKGKHRVADERIEYLETKIEQLQAMFREIVTNDCVTPEESEAMVLKFIGDKDAKATDVET